MKILKKFSILVAASLMLGQLPLSPPAQVSAANGDTFELDGFTYEIINNNLEAKIIGVADTSVATFTTRDTITYGNFEYPVTAISLSDEASFQGKETLTSVSFGKNINTIQGTIFSGCSNLSSVTLPPSLRLISSDTFKNCTSLSSIEIPASLASIEGFNNRSPFRGCTGLKSITFAEGTTVIPNGLFKQCDFIDAISLPATLTEIHTAAFEECTNLKDIAFPPSLKKIEHYAFKKTGLTNLTLTEGIESLGYETFSECPSLTTVTIPASLGDVTGLWTNKSPFIGCTALSNISFNPGTTRIGAGLFGKCDYLKAISIPDTVKEIGNNAFEGCSSLTEIKLPKDLTDIGSEAFLDCTRLTSINLPEGTKNIGYDAFKNCQSITSATIPTSLETITGLWDARGIFGGCSRLTEITLTDGMKKIPDNLFSSCDFITAINIPATVRIIGNGAFNGCTALTGISLPDDVEAIGKEAFMNCSRLTEITLPKYLETIGFSAFEGCSSLAKVRFQSTVKEVTGLWDDRGPFNKLASITDMTIDDGVTSIPAYLFANAGLKNLVIPSSVKTIDPNAAKNASTDLIIYADENSVAATYAKENSITYKPMAEAPKVSLPSLGCLPSLRKQQVLEGPKEATINLSGEKTAKLNFSSNAADDQALITYFSTNPSVAEVDATGLVTGLSAGTTTITVSSGKTTNYTEAEDVTVTVKVVADNNTPGGNDDPGNNNNPGNNNPPGNTMNPGNTDGSGNTNNPGNTENKLPAKGKTVTVGGVKYKITKSAAKNGTVSVSGIKSKKAKKVTIAASVKISGYTFKVTSIASKAFSGCKKLKSIKVKSSSIKSVGKKAFYKVPKSAKASVPKKKKATYKKLFKKGGFKGKVK